MLGKLLKYDFKFISRMMVPLYVGMLLISLLFGLVMRGTTDAELVDNIMPFLELSGSGGGNLIVTIVQVVVTLLFAAVFTVGYVLTLVLIIQNYYKNLLGSQGYLMFSLPVETKSHITAKVVSGAFWMLLGIVMSILSLFIIFLCILGPDQVLPALGEFIVDVCREIGIPRAILLIVQLILVFMFGCACSVVKIYAAISIGHHWMNHRIFGSILAYVAFGVIETVLAVILFRFVDINAVFDWIGNFDLWAPSLGLLIIGAIYLIIDAIYWLISWGTLNNKLNLA